MNKEYIRVPDKEAGDNHKCACCCITQQCICNLKYQEIHNMGCCSDGYFYKEKKSV